MDAAKRISSSTGKSVDWRKYSLLQLISIENRTPAPRSFSPSSIARTRPSHGKANSDSSLKYNVMEDKWEYAADNASLKYNVMEDKWEYAPDNASTRYNVMQDKWEYAPDNASTRYNVMEDKWEYATDGESLKYNVMEDKWEYAP